MRLCSAHRSQWFCHSWSTHTSWMNVHTDKYFRNLIKSNWYQIVFTIFLLIWIQTDVCLVPNPSENGEYNLISGLFGLIYIFQLIWNETDVRLVPNQSENEKYNLISVWFNKISKIFLCVYGPTKVAMRWEKLCKNCMVKWSLQSKAAVYTDMGQRPFFEGRWTFLLANSPVDKSPKLTEP